MNVVVTCAQDVSQRIAVADQTADLEQHTEWRISEVR